MIFQLVLIVEPLDAISLGANDFRADETLHNLKLKIEILKCFIFYWKKVYAPIRETAYNVLNYFANFKQMLE